METRQRLYSFIEVRYRNGQKETFPSNYRFKTDDASNLWVCDQEGPLYVRSGVAGITLVEVEVASWQEGWAVKGQVIARRRVEVAS
jgi:hypothetical protein